MLRLSGFVFALAFGVAAWAGVDSASFATLSWFMFIIIIGIISPIIGIVLAIVLSSVLSGIFPPEADGKNPLSGPLAGLFFGAIAHAVILFMEQLILDLVDAAFMCFAIDAHNGIVSPRGEVVHRFMGTNFGDQLSDKGKESAGVTDEEDKLGSRTTVNPVPGAAAALPPPGSVPPPPPVAVMPAPASSGAYAGDAQL